LRLIKINMFESYNGCRYHGSKKAAEAEMPFDAGFETVSVVAAVGKGVKGGCLRHLSILSNAMYVGT